MIQNEILKDCHIITLEVLSGEIDAEVYMQYEKDLEKYNDDLERMNFVTDKPEEPDFNIQYRKQRFNLAAMDILHWYADWDEKRDCEVVVLNFLYHKLATPEQINIKISEKEWVDILTNFGANLY